MEWSTAIVGVPGCRNKPTVPAGDCCVGGWVRPLMNNTTTFVRNGDWRCSTFGASNHKSTRATPGSFTIKVWVDLTYAAPC